jgi:hypothetical protein
MDDHPWVRKKSEDDRFPACIPRQLIDTRYDLTVAQMYAVEGADGDDGIPQGFKIVNMMVDVHCLISDVGCSISDFKKAI